MRFLAIAALVFVANCGAAPPDSPPDITLPPEVSTEGAVVIETTATVPMDVATFRAFLQDNPLIGFLEPVDDLAPPVEARVLEGNWPDPWAVRWLRLEDGHYVIERILENEPETFRYQIWVITNSAGRAVEQIVGEQTFTPLGDRQTRFDWTYSIKPRNGLARFFINQRRSVFEDYLGGATDRMAEAARADVNGS